MNIFYRGYVIHEDIRSICYTIYGRRPARRELDAQCTAQEAMQWVDRDLEAEAKVAYKGTVQLALL
ncbi:MAG: hypothetical protein BZY88_10980 [SAR202 cluster bacterium Io17-Chloro-G9]|nr:MAG: hypothetical protein BZY88_10980 [SAR202 cluster bacterium Io17-Chloro-G9]